MTAWAPIDAIIAFLGVVLVPRWWLLWGAANVDAARRVGAPDIAVGGTITVLIPAYEEEVVIAATVLSVLASDHKDLDVIVIDDGSKDRTGKIVESLAQRDPRVRLLTMSPNGGKSRALNAGLAAARSAFVVTIDADTTVRPDTVRRLVGPLFADARTGAVAGNIKVGNRASLLGIWQSIEYVTALHFDRRAQAATGCITTVPGACGAFRREAVLAAGGWSPLTVTEDTDLTLAIQRSGWRVAFEPRAVADTEAPSDWSGLWRQRSRWTLGYLQCLAVHRGAFLRYGTLGWWGLPNLLLSQLILPLLFPFVVFAPQRLAAWFDPTATAWGVLTWLATELGIGLWAYTIDGERRSELLHLPVFRTVWPLFAWAAFLVAAARFLARAAPTWDRVPRLGAGLTR